LQFSAFLFYNKHQKEILNNRQQSVKPLVDAYFEWIKSLQFKSISSAKPREAVNYSAISSFFSGHFLMLQSFRWIITMQNTVSRPSAWASTHGTSLIQPEVLMTLHCFTA
jgi:hypothetical protein